MCRISAATGTFSRDWLVQVAAGGASPDLAACRSGHTSAQAVAGGMLSRRRSPSFALLAFTIFFLGCQAARPRSSGSVLGNAAIAPPQRGELAPDRQALIAMLGS